MPRRRIVVSGDGDTASDSEGSYSGESVFDGTAEALEHGVDLAKLKITEAVPTPESDSEEAKQKHAEIQKGPMRAEVKHLDKRFTEKGQSYTVETKEFDIKETVDWYEKYALTVTRQFDSRNREVQSTSLQINSAHLQELLKDVIGEYPGLSFQTKAISVPFPCHALFHYRHELKQAGSKFEAGSDAAAHVQTLLGFISEHFADAIAEGDNLRDQGLTNYEHLWTILKPGCLIVSTVLSQQCAFTLQSYQYICGMSPGLRLSTSHVDFDGDAFGTRPAYLKIPPFSGTAGISNLNAYPLDLIPSADAIKKTLISRGRKFEALAGQNLRTYQHVALDTYTDEEKTLRFNIEGRVMIDCKTFHRLVPDDAFEVQPFMNPDAAKTEQALQDDWDLLPNQTPALVALNDDQCLLASAKVRGFSFSEKKFLDFFVDKLSPIEWNSQCFEQLVLPQSQKELVQVLVAEHSKRHGRYDAPGFDDIVKGKGRGLVLVLHGPPGVGKTLTAECVAEFALRPLYIVSSGELGTSCETLDERLTKILDMASTWNAVLLIDEADVFLERRSLNDMERNGLVSIFLRVLEYYQGILFMTTNRVRTFDDAVRTFPNSLWLFESKANKLPIVQKQDTCTIKVWRPPPQQSCANLAQLPGQGHRRGH